MDFIVKKLGWENAAQIHNSAHNIYNDFVSWKTQAIVVSAMRSSYFNTTDKLILLWKELSKKNIDEKNIFNLIESIKNFHLKLLECELLWPKEKVIIIINNLFKIFIENIKFFIENRTEKDIPKRNNDYSIELKNKNKLSIIGFWEIISSKIISGVIDSISANWICSKSIDLWDIVSSKNLVKKAENEVFDMLTEKVSNIIDENIIGWHIPVLSGYIWSFPKWIEKTIGRWYSDATAAISATGLAKKWYSVTIEVQKSVKWLMSADPSILYNPEDAQVLEKIDYLTAREITWDNWAQAKLLHHQTLRSEVQEAGIKIHLFDPFSGEEGTWIIDKRKCTNIKPWIRFIWWRKNIIFFSISSWKMFERSILSRLFNIVQKYFSVDIVTSSETEVSFTIDWEWVSDEILNEMTNKIKKEFNLYNNSDVEFVEYKKDRALIFCVWEHMKDYVKVLWKSIQIFAENDIDIKLISQGRLERAIIFGIVQKDRIKAVNLLHNEFIVWKK